MKLSSVICSQMIFAISNRFQKVIIYGVIEHPIIEDIEKSVNELDIGNTPIFDDVPEDFLLHGGNSFTVKIYYLISDIWLGTPVLQD